MTREDKHQLAALFVLACGWAYVIAMVYDAGRTIERQSRDAVACTPSVDSVRVVPLRWPSGPVAGARP